MTAERPERIRTRRPALQATVAVVCLASLIAADARPSETQVMASGPVEIRVGQGTDMARVELRGAQGLRARIRREGAQVIVSLPKGAKPQLARLTLDPPKGVSKVEGREGASGPEIVFTLAEGVVSHDGKADGAVYLTFQPDTAAPPPAPAAPAEPARPSAAPASGVIKVAAKADKATLTLTVPWAQPVGAAVFRHGGAVWIVFDAKAKLDLTAVPKTFGEIKGLQWAQGPDFTVLRVQAPEQVAASAEAKGPMWTFAFGGEPQPPPEGEPKIGRDDQTGPAALTAALAGASKVVWVRDPTVGDRVAVVTAPGPLKPTGHGRSFVEAKLLPTLHGLAIQAETSDLSVKLMDRDLVRITRPRGLSLSSADAAKRAALPAQLPQPSLMPGLIDFTRWSDTGGAGFSARYAQMQELAYQEGGKGPSAPIAMRMAFARFLVGSELSYEAIGELNLLAKQNGSASGDAEFRGLRGAARVIAHRYKEAQADFSAPSLANDPASAVWRAYIDAKLGDWADAKKGFQAGAKAIDLFAPRWKSRFATANAQANMETGDLRAASTLIDFALAQKPSPEDQLAIRLIQAKLFLLQGERDRALAVFDAVGRAPLDGLAAPAQLAALRIRLERGAIKPDDAERTLESLKYRWRGDSTEIEVARTSGQIYLDQGRYREALEAMRAGGKRMPDLPEAQKLQTDLSQAFRGLFLDGKADALQPIQALALFSDFRDLTPVGADGDEMVRRMSRRLVDVDLLDQAADLLKYQVEHRLDGVAKSQVATDLATVYLMNHKPELALQALWNSRTTLLPNALNARRRVLEVRSLTELGRYDQAIEILGKDVSPDALDVRAEIAWRQQDWATAAQVLEKRLGDRWKGQPPLSGEDETRLIRAGVAYSLVHDEKALERLNERWSAYVEQAKAPDALRLALSRFDAGIAPADFARAAAQADTFAGWVAEMKHRFAGPAFGR